NPLPKLTSVPDVYDCTNNTDGFAYFDLEQVEEDIIDNRINIGVEFYRETGEQIQSPLNAVKNLVISEEEITVHVINTITNCHNEGTFKLMVNPLPVANVLSGLIGCDNDDD